MNSRRAIIATGRERAPAAVSISLSVEYAPMALSYALDAGELTDVAARLQVRTLDVGRCRRQNRCLRIARLNCPTSRTT